MVCLVEKSDNMAEVQLMLDLYKSWLPKSDFEFLSVGPVKLKLVDYLKLDSSPPVGGSE